MPNEKFSKAEANAWLAEGKADAIAFGIPFIANPDLPKRLETDAPLNQPRPELFYGKGPVRLYRLPYFGLTLALETNKGPTGPLFTQVLFRLWRKTDLHTKVG